MVFTEGLKTVRWDREGINIIERDKVLARMLEQHMIKDKLARVLKNRLTPLCLEEWQEEHYNVMA